MSVAVKSEFWHFICFLLIRCHKESDTLTWKQATYYISHLHSWLKNEDWHTELCSFSVYSFSLSLMQTCGCMHSHFHCPPSPLVCSLADGVRLRGDATSPAGCHQPRHHLQTHMHPWVTLTHIHAPADHQGCSQRQATNNLLPSHEIRLKEVYCHSLFKVNEVLISVRLCITKALVMNYTVVL